jgi:hypothetical protein
MKNKLKDFIFLRKINCKIKNPVICLFTGSRSESSKKIPIEINFISVFLIFIFMRGNRITNSYD